MTPVAYANFADQRVEDRLEVIRALYRTNCFAPPGGDTQPKTRPKTPVQLLQSARAEKIPPANWSTFGEVRFNNDCFVPLRTIVGAPSTPSRWSTRVGALSSPSCFSRDESPIGVHQYISEEPFGPPPTLGNIREENSKWIYHPKKQACPRSSMKQIPPRLRCISEPSVELCHLGGIFSLCAQCFFVPCCRIVRPGGDSLLIEPLHYF